MDLSDSTISNLVLTTTGNCDGLALVENGNCYFSSWATNSVYYYDTTFTNYPVLFSSGHIGRSNICFNNLAARIIIQVYWIHSFHWLRALYPGLAIIEMISGWLLRKALRAPVCSTDISAR